MKRYVKKQYRDPWILGPNKTIFPIIFEGVECDCCERIITFERMWKAIGGPWVGRVGVERFLCNECAWNKDEAVKYFHEFRPVWERSTCPFVEHNMSPPEVMAYWRRHKKVPELVQTSSSPRNSVGRVMGL